MFTGLLFYAYDGKHQVRTLVFDNNQMYTVSRRIYVDCNILLLKYRLITQNNC